MRFILLLPLCLVACAGGQPSGSAVYLYPGSKVEIVKGNECAVHENVTKDVLATASIDTESWGEAHTRKDPAGSNLVKVTPCGK